MIWKSLEVKDYVIQPEQKENTSKLLSNLANEINQTFEDPNNKIPDKYTEENIFSKLTKNVPDPEWKKFEYSMNKEVNNPYTEEIKNLLTQTTAELKYLYKQITKQNSNQTPDYQFTA